MKISKKQQEIQKVFEKDKDYSLDNAIEVLKKAPKANFDESIDVCMSLNVDQKKLTQPIRGTVALIHGTGKKIKVCCICKGEDETKATEAGADSVGSNELIAKIAGGWTDFDVCVATPEMMREMAKLGKVLGPKGLMPNPKSGTVTTDVAKAVKEIKAGKIEYKMDKLSGIHVSIGKLSFEGKKLFENVSDFIGTVISANAAVSKPNAIKAIFLSKTMGPGIKLDINEFKKS